MLTVCRDTLVKWDKDWHLISEQYGGCRVYKRKDVEKLCFKTLGLLSVKQTCKRLNVSRVTLGTWRKNGRLKPFRMIATHPYYRLEDIQNVKKKR